MANQRQAFGIRQIQVQRFELAHWAINQNRGFAHEQK
jgi:hypothetical protein